MIECIICNDPFTATPPQAKPPNPLARLESETDRRRRQPKPRPYPVLTLGLLAFIVTMGVLILAFWKNQPNYATTTEKPKARIYYPTQATVQKAVGKFLTGKAVCARSESDYLKLMNAVSDDAMEAVTAYERRGEVWLIEAGTRVRIVSYSEPSPFVSVHILDGKHAGRDAVMIVDECGGSSDLIKKPK